MKSILFFLLFILHFSANANDGVYYTSGNQLIPISETSIRVQKEILKLKKVNQDYIEVSVYYEFFNPGNAKEITVGFEAFSPSGDVDGAPKNGMHPFMHQFTVLFNNQKLPFKVAAVADSLYNNHGKIKAINLTTFEGRKEGNEVDFFYVYHFKANFKKGLNIIKHTYKYKLSGSIDLTYNFEYVLTAAKRWGNGQIDDFTLILDMGSFETFDIPKTFFNNKNDWQIKGIGNVVETNGHDLLYNPFDALQFNMRQGEIVFQQKNFKPMAELFVYNKRYLVSDERFDYEVNYLPFSIFDQNSIPAPDTNNPINKRILYNLPFARRGYVFKDTVLNHFFSHLPWYIPDANYKPDINLLTLAEKKWLERFK